MLLNADVNWPHQTSPVTEGS